MFVWADGVSGEELPPQPINIAKIAQIDKILYIIM
jgi:hypothetical protein